MRVAALFTVSQSQFGPALDFRSKFMALNQSYSPNPDREVYRAPSSLPALSCLA